MKVCMVVPEFVPSMGKPPLYIARRLIKSGHEVTILTSDYDLADRKIRFKVNELESATTKRFWSFMAFKKIVTPSLIFKLLSINADVMYVDGFGHFSSGVAAFVGKLRGIPVVLRADWNGMPIIGKGLKGVYDRYVKFPTLTNSSKIFVFSKKQRELMAGYGINDGKIEVFPNGVDYDEFASPARSNYLKSKFGIKDDCKVILTVCRIMPGKNPELAIRALAKVLKSNENIASVIVGQKENSIYYEHLVKLAEELGVQNNVFFMLEVNHKDMPKIYSSADVFFLTSRPIEGMNLSTIEAMCAGLPIVTTEVSVTPEIINEAKCGFVIKNEEDASEKISYLLANESVMKRLGENGKSFARANLDWARLTERMEALMESETVRKG